MIAFVAIAMVIIPSMVVLNINGGQSTVRQQQGSLALTMAEAGIENAMMRLLRDNTYAGETLVIDGNTVTTSVTGTTIKTVLATGSAGVYRRTVEITASNSAGILDIITWREK